ncbi:MAG TPA: hypothetical protein VMN58_08335 [Acidimicrobiales bacterium]|nr:hypothetical protein [Acidimicrobiales bacterium]
MSFGRRAVSVLLVASLLASCSGDDGGTDETGEVDPQVVRDSINLVASDGTTAIAFSVRLEGLPPDFGDLSVTGEGLASLDHDGARIELEVSEGMAEVVGAEAGVVELVDDGTEAVVRAQGEPWRQVTGEARQGGGGGFTLIRGTDALAGVRFMERAVVTARLLGSNDVRGRPATRYLVTLDPSVVEGDDAAAAIAADLDAAGFGILAGYAWVDDDGRLVRARYDVDLGDLTGGGPFGAGGRFVSEVELFDVGADLDRTLPTVGGRGGQAVEPTELRRLLGGVAS